MLCDQCGYDVPIAMKCPNCGYDNSNTDYEPVNMNLINDPMDELVDDIFLDMEKRAEHRREFH